MTPQVAVVVGLAAVLIGVSKGGLSVGGPVLTILVSLALPAKVAIGVLLPLLIVGDVFAVAAHWGRWDRDLLVQLLPGGLVGVGMASVGLAGMSERSLQLIIAVVTLSFVVLRLVEAWLAQLRLRPGAVPGTMAGVASGVASTVAHVGGPPIAIYLLAIRTPSTVYVATSALFFAVINWLKVPGYLAAGLFDPALLIRTAPAALLIPPSVVIGRWAVHRLSQRSFDRMVLASLLVGAVLLVLE
ncbi:MAG: sulfite exporter TauE/SafE family protein [Acidimicrobiales bacterium]